MRGANLSRTAAVAAVLLASACSNSGSDVTGDAAGTSGERARPSATTVIHCEPSIAAPEGFGLTKVTPVPVAGHTGVRRSYADDDGRLLHISAGIRGEYAEGAEVVQEVTLAQGRGKASLYGAGDTWVLVWDEGEECGYMAVVGNGFARDDLMEVLGESGLI